MRNVKMTQSSGPLLTLTMCGLCAALLTACSVDKPNNAASSGNSNAESPGLTISASQLHGYSISPGTLVTVTNLEVGEINNAAASVDLFDEAGRRETFEGKTLAQVIVTCFVDDDQKAALAKLSKGHRVTIQGRAAGTVIEILQVKNCVITVTESVNTPSPPSESGNTRTIEGGVLNGKAISLVQPSYPEIARGARASGQVRVEVVVDENGNVTSAKAVSGHPLLHAAATNAALASKFTPAQLSGQPVKVRGTIIYNFVAP